MAGPIVPNAPRRRSMHTGTQASDRGVNDREFGSSSLPKRKARPMCSRMGRSRRTSTTGPGTRSEHRRDRRTARSGFRTISVRTELRRRINLPIRPVRRASSSMPEPERSVSRARGRVDLAAELPVPGPRPGCALRQPMRCLARTEKRADGLTASSGGFSPPIPVTDLEDRARLSARRPSGRLQLTIRITLAVAPRRRR